MTHYDTSWFDEDAPLLRPYAVTRGRTVGAGHDLDMLTLVVVADRPPQLRYTEPEYADVLRLCRIAHSVAEVSAHLRLPLAVTKIVVGDLIGDGYLNFRAPLNTEIGPHDVHLLRAVLDGIRRL
ncbi:DUF742 domain-containing protein [Nocardia sp. alder85J]|uniref:DUF742 domain-containing protein n=1 Tax=Nocardia sp. alder85J TaxID=2862949 RepID=UPI002253BD2F|nr:DUF742 domain-containing protein [Nocardia sp. alder85J]MCX4091743.1 DUF742 domain-containing protein [Nocardia sp. alder85J]